MPQQRTSSLTPEEQQQQGGNNNSGRAGSTGQTPSGPNQIPPHLQFLYDQANAPVPGDIAPPSGDPSGVNMDEYTAGLMAQLLGLMDQQANTDLANSQISQLSSILSQRSALAGKDLAAGTFASGGATAANISGILRGEQQALGQGITQIQGDALARSQSNQATALGMMLNLRGQLSAENQADFDNRLATAQFEFEKWRTEEGFRLTEEEIEAQRMSFIIEAIGAIIPG
jgi:hypothetical protein